MKKILQFFILLVWAGYFTLILLAPLSAQEWRDQISALKIGLIQKPEYAHIDQPSQPLRRYLENKLNITVAIKLYRSQERMIQHLHSSRLHMVIFSSSAYAAASIICSCVEPIAAITAPDGSIGFRSILVSHARNKFTQLSDIKNKKFVFAGSGSTSGVLVPKAALLSSSFPNVSLEANDQMASSPASALNSLIKGDIDALFTWTPDFKDGRVQLGSDNIVLRLAGSHSANGLQVIWQSRSIPYNAIAVQQSLSSQLKQLLQKLLIELPQEQASIFQFIADQPGSGLTVIDKEAYETIIEVVQVLANTAS